MIEEYEYLYYLSYAAVCLATVIMYIKVRSTEAILITTKEFKIFRNSFLGGYIAVLFVELLSVASFYHVLTNLKLSLEEITDLYIVTIVSSAAFGAVIEIIDIGSRKSKCIMTALLFAISLFTLYDGSNYELLLLGRVVYGLASVLLHSAFESYLVHENASIGYPEDWLMHSFGVLAHSMAFVSAGTGSVGQALVGMGGPSACITFSLLVCIGVALFISASWATDISGSRFALTGFVQTCGQTIQACRSNQGLLNLVLMSCSFEACITIFTFYWAPWMESAIKEESHTVPFELVFSALATSSMLGNYFYGLLSPQWGHDSLLQIVLSVSASAFFLGAVFNTPAFMMLIALAIQCCVGFYWPGLGVLRGRFTLPEHRTAAVLLCRALTTAIVVPVLGTIHHKPTLILLVCSCLNMAAVYFQSQLQQGDFDKELDEEDDEESS